MISKSVSILISLALMFTVGVPNVWAHAGVQEKEVGIGSLQTFNFGVPNEKEDASTTGLRLIIPEGVEDILANIYPGWNVEVKKTTVNGEEKVTEVIWTGGNIPPGQRGLVSITAKVPPEETILVWKTYQTYSDGETVAWDKNPEEVANYQKSKPAVSTGVHDDDLNAPKPYSTTKVINDLKASTQPVANSNSGPTAVAGEQNNNTPMILSVIAVLLSAGSFGLQWFRRPSKKSY